MKHLLRLCLLLPLITFSQQPLQRELDSVTSMEKAEEFIDHHKAAKAKLLTFNEEKHKTKLASELFRISKGGKKVIESDYKTSYYKVIDKVKVMHNRVSYILLDGTKLSADEISARRTQILNKYREGYNFGMLAKYFSMDTNAKKGGDLGWFAEDQMHPKFIEQVKSHAVNEIFTLDIPEKKAHYVVLKTYEQKPIKEITVLKFSETKK